jgi:hypothetical protein
MNVVLTLLLQIISQISGNATVDLIARIISALEILIPLIKDEIQTLYPIVQNIIAALRGNGEITQDQMDALDKAESALDDQFDAANAAAMAEENKG